jgi:hypothetical protein
VHDIGRWTIKEAAALAALRVIDADATIDTSTDAADFDRAVSITRSRPPRIST